MPRGGMVQLQGLTELRALNLRETMVTDACLASLKSLIRLEELNLIETGIGDTGLLHLVSLARIKQAVPRWDEGQRCRIGTTEGPD